jgi:gluconate 2-dehydrogenase alpha chain
MQKGVDVVLIGMGCVGGILASELSAAGLKVVGLERGESPPYSDYSLKDSVHAVVRHALHDSARHEPVARREKSSEETRRQSVSSPTNQVGGALNRWTGQSNRFAPGDFKVFSNEIASGLADRAGAALEGYSIADWPISYDDLEPYYTKYEYEMGITGADGENPFAGPRSKPFPLPPLRETAKSIVFRDACKSLGYHPYSTPNAILSRRYKPPKPYAQGIPERPACVYCGHCNNYGCHVHAKASTLYTHVPAALATGNLDLRTRCKVFRINTDASGYVTGVSYFDTDGSVHEQRASVVVLGGYLYENVRLLLLSQHGNGAHSAGLGNSHGLVGRHIMAHEDVRVSAIFDDRIINGFIGPGSCGGRIDDFNSNNFDHTGLGFIRGATIGTSGSGTPIERYNIVPPGVPRWGGAYKQYICRYYNRCFDLNMQPETLPHEENSIDLHPTERDAWGVPLPRVTFSLHENERRMHSFLASIGEEIMWAAGASKVWSAFSRRASRWAGGTRMGTDPANSVVNEQCQVHGLDNLFVIGASVFPTMSGYPPTATVAALAYRAADYVRARADFFR